jgi:hypothetical protein
MMFILAFLVLLSTVRSKWLQLFGLGLVVSFMFSGGHFTYLALPIIYIAAIDRLKEVFHVKHLIRFYVAIMVIVSLMCVYTYGQYGYFVGSLGNTVLTGPMLAIGAVLAMRVHWGVAVWLSIAALLTQSSTAAICLAAGFTPSLYRRGQRGLFIAGQAVAVVGFMYFVDPLHQFRDRIVMLTEAIERGRGQLFGHGAGSFKAIFAQLPDVTLTHGQAWAQAHNDLVQLFFEAGYIPFILATMFVLWHCYKSSKLTHLTNRKVAVGAMSAFIVFALVGFPFHYAPAAGAFGVVWSAYTEGA